MNRRTIFSIFLIVLIISTLLLVTGSKILGTPVFPGSGMPWGTIITWAGLISLPSTIFFGIEKIRYPGTTIFRILNIVNKIAMLFASLWVFLSYYFANNWAFIFKQQTEFRGSTRASVYFWNFTIFIISISLALLTVFFTLNILSKIKSKTQSRT